MDLHHTLITEIFELRESLIVKTDRLLSLLRSTNASPIENFNGKKSPRPRKDSPFKKGPDVKTPSLADLGCRITSQDYAASGAAPTNSQTSLFESRSKIAAASSNTKLAPSHPMKLNLLRAELMPPPQLSRSKTFDAGSQRQEKIETPLKISVVVDSGSISPEVSQSKLGRGLSTLKRNVSMTSRPRLRVLADRFAPEQHSRSDSVVDQSIIFPNKSEHGIKSVSQTSNPESPTIPLLASNSASCDSDPKQTDTGEAQQALSQTYSFQSESIPFDANCSTHEMKDVLESLTHLSQPSPSSRIRNPQPSGLRHIGTSAIKNMDEYKKDFRRDFSDPVRSTSFASITHGQQELRKHSGDEQSSFGVYRPQLSRSKPGISQRASSLRWSAHSVASLQSVFSGPRHSLANTEKTRKSFVLRQDTLTYTQFGFWKRAQFCFLLPAYDNKGQRIRIEHFDVADFDSISFMEYGLHPKSDFSTVWDLVMISAYFVILWTTPFIVGFDMNHEVMHNVQIAVTIVYLLDSLVAMLTPQSDVTDSTSSFREYESARPSLSTWLRSWFKFQLFFDLISIIPFAVFMETEAEKVLSFIRLVRIVRIPGMMQRCAFFRRAKLWIDDTLGIGISKTLPVALTIFFFIHMNACTMYFVAKTNDFRGWDLVWPGFLAASEFEAYTWTFFLAVGNLFPMAFKPQTAIEQILAACQICVGAVLYAAFVGLVSSAAISLNASGRLYNQKMEELIDYVKWKRLDTATRDKLVSYYETKYRGKYFEEDALLSDMNDSLREEIACHNTRGLMEKVPFLRREEMDGRDDTYFYKLATVLHARYFIPGDFMMKQGESGSDMYFILSGKVNVFVDGNRVTSLYDSSYIGEMSLITKSRRTATVQVALPSVTYRLTRQDFLTVIGEFPDMRARINAMVEEGERIARSP
ncbi:hypothetical protein CcCBS67573_g10119 [Chytriomyces confervae]|uniref:Cyclic nucleotide-binding domain-containing protein n=1 Tax=Chytriomyces confervae TaxID=246404 RepID=A0A507DFC1_9FUNG|nr:hypothetical protein CcCBS67573_g10119 [Chytriomyces confervae]